MTKDNDPPLDGPENGPVHETSFTLQKGKDKRFSARDEDFSGANDEAIAIRIATLEEEHRDLDAAIRALEITSPYERLVIARLKKKKLGLKDEIQKLKDSMLPDIIA